MEKVHKGLWLIAAILMFCKYNKAAVVTDEFSSGDIDVGELTRSAPGNSGHEKRPPAGYVGHCIYNIMDHSGSLQNCTRYYEENPDNEQDVLEWCGTMYHTYGTGARCHILQHYVERCEGDIGGAICEDTWREEYTCPKPGVLITTPNLWSSGENGEVCVDLINIHVPSSVDISLVRDGVEESTISTTMSSSGCVDVPAPADCAMNKRDLIVRVQNEFFTYTSPADKPTTIVCADRGSLTFIQTDKPIYKPGQQVLFRVLSVSLAGLKPILGNIDIVYIETPSGVRVEQYTNTATNLGLAEFSFPLDIHPPLGDNWRIVVQNPPGGGTHTKEFQVQEFVLPKWDVKLDGPEDVFDFSPATFTLCAHFTFGQPVEGDYEITVKTTDRYRNTMDSIMFTGQVPTDSGCVTVTVSADDLDYYQTWYYLDVVASVTQTATGTERTADSRNRILSRYFGLAFHPNTARYFKRNSPIPGKISVSSSDGNGGVAVDLSLSVEGQTVYSSTEFTDDEGGLEYLIPPGLISDTATSAYIYMKTPDVSKSWYLRGWWSSSDHFVTVVPLYNQIPCDAPYHFPIYHNADRGTLFRYIITSKGNVVLTGHTQIPFGGITVGNAFVRFFQLTVDINPAMSGDAKLLVYYVTPEMEFVADVISLDVEKCFQNKVGFKFNKKKGEPGDSVKYELTAATDSLCGIGVIDRSLEILAGNSFILTQQVFGALRRLDLRYTWNQFETDKYCREKDEKPPQVPEGCEAPDDQGTVTPEPTTTPSDCYTYTYYWSNFEDSSLALNTLGVLVQSTKVEIQTRPCNKNTWTRCFVKQPTTTTPPPIPAPPPPPPVVPPEEDDNRQSNGASDAESVDIRTFFPETFLWDLVVVEKGKVKSDKLTLPDTITEWYGNAICTNTEAGLGISNFASIITFQTFFLYLELPYSVISGETLHIPVLLFNYLDKEECLALNVKLTDEDSFDIQGSSEFNICLCGEQSTSVEFVITPTQLGQTYITAVAVSTDDASVCDDILSDVQKSDGVTRQLLVKPPGIQESYGFGGYYCANTSFSLELTLPLNYVPESEYGHFSVIGDIMGPALDGLTNLIKMPTGCGEQTAYLTAQAAIVFKYLKTIGEDMPEATTKALTSMKHGYQRELTYKNNDGSYSVFIGYQASNWLTAFVVRVFAMSSEFIFIDPNEQEISMQWLEGDQNQDGCFPQIGQVIHSDMQGGLEGGNQPIALTAFIVISLMEAGRPDTATSVSSAMSCLDTADIADMTTYALVVSAYAYTLHGGNAIRRADVLVELYNRAVQEDGMTYWSSDVEMTAYVLLAVIGGDNPLFYGMPIAMWLATQRNSLGGWSSTQNTFVALHAMSLFAELLTLGGDMDVDVSVMPPNLNFHVDSTNMRVLQKADLDVPNDIDISITGNGCVVAQADVAYNVIPVRPSEPYFNVDYDVQDTECKCKAKILDICITYEHDDGPTNMAVVEIKIVSGYSVYRNTAPQTWDQTHPIPEDVGVITKVEYEDDLLIVYFDKMTTNESCFRFEIHPENNVDDLKPGTIKVWDYYRTHVTSGMEYSLDSPPNCNIRHCD